MLSFEPNNRPSWDEVLKILKRVMDNYGISDN